MAGLTFGSLLAMVGLLGTPTVAQASTAPGTIDTFAGGPGRGAATNVGQGPAGVTLAGSRLIVSDTANNVVRSVDLLSGRETVVAGLGGLYVHGYTGDGGPATKAKLAGPRATAVDGAGNVYIADNGCLVRKVDHATGIITTVAGTYPCAPTGTFYSGEGGPATAAVLGAIKSLAFDKASNLFLTDDRFYRVYEVSTAAGITTVAGTGEYSGVSTGDGGPATQATIAPDSVAVDPDGNVYVDDFPAEIRRIDHATRVITAVASRYGPIALSPDAKQIYLGADLNVYKADLSATGTAGPFVVVAGNGTRGFSGDGGPARKASLNVAKFGVAVGPAGLFFTDWNNDRVRRVRNGIITTVAGNGALNFGGDGGPARSAQMGRTMYSIVRDGDGNTYFTDVDSSRVRKISANGTMSTVAGSTQLNTYAGGYSGDGGPATKAALNGPYGLAVDGDALYIADTSNCRVRQVKAGIITTVVGDGNCNSAGDGGLASAAEVNYPTNLVFDQDHNLYIGGDCRVRKVDHTTGILTTVVGTGNCGFSGDGGPAASADVSYGFGLVFDAAGNLFVSDQGNCVVHKVDLSQTITTVAGTPGVCNDAGDGGLATAAQIVPSGIAVDSAGHLYIADLNSVRRVAGGIITTIAGQTAPYFTDPSPAGFSGDGGPASAARLSNVQALSIAGGILYFGDDNQRIRTVSLG